MNEFLIIILISLAVATYMFLSLKFKFLRWIFTPKSFITGGKPLKERLIIAEKIGLVVAPIIGSIALLFLVFCGFSWKNSLDNQKESEERKVEQQHKHLSQVQDILSNWEVSKVSKGKTSLRESDMKGHETLEKVLKIFGEQLTFTDFPRRTENIPTSAESWVIKMKDPKSGVSSASIVFNPECSNLKISCTGVGKYRQLRNYTPLINTSNLETLKSLNEINTVDLNKERKEEQNRLKAEREKVDSYKLLTHVKPSVKKTLGLLQELSNEDKDDLLQKYLGKTVDWDLRIRMLSTDQSGSRISAFQNNTKEKPYSVKIEQVPGDFAKRYSERKILPLIRIKGKISDIEFTKLKNGNFQGSRVLLQCESISDIKL